MKFWIVLTENLPLLLAAHATISGLYADSPNLMLIGQIWLAAWWVSKQKKGSS